jgi:hypothetical protein
MRQSAALLALQPKFLGFSRRRALSSFLWLNLGIFHASEGRIGGMKLSIRDLFWLTVVVSLALGWWLDRSRLAAIALFWQDHAYAIQGVPPDSPNALPPPKQPKN